MKHRAAVSDDRATTPPRRRLRAALHGALAAMAGLAGTAQVLAAAPAAAPVPTTAQAPAPRTPTQGTSERGAVNPLTGQSLAFEATQRRLEQMRLETQLLEEEAKQANLRNGMSLAPIRRSNEERRLQAEMFGPLPLTQTLAQPGGSAAGAIAGPARPLPPQAPRRAEVRPVAPAAATAAPAPGGSLAAAAAGAAAASSPGAAAAAQVLAILRSGERRRAIVQLGGTTLTVSEGDQVLGRLIGPITDGSVSIDGLPIDLPRTPAVVAAIDRRGPAGTPPGLATPAGGAAGLAAPALGAGAAQRVTPTLASSTFPPLPALPVIGPVEPDNPLSALGPQTMPRPPVQLPPLPAGAAAPGVQR
jgi:hypothetical protein